MKGFLAPQNATTKSCIKLEQGLLGVIYFYLWPHIHIFLKLRIINAFNHVH